MTKRKVWMVRAGKGGTYADEFIEQSFVGIGWTELGEIDAPTSKMELKRRVEAEYPNERPGTLDSWASQIKRYVSEIDIGDEVTTYDPDQRLYFLGTIRSRESLDRSHDLGRRRSVKWDRKVARDSLSVAARNSLGAISTLFRVPPEVAVEMRSLAVGLDDLIAGEHRRAPSRPKSDDSEAGDEKEILDEVVSKASEFIEDRIAKLSPDQMEEFVAGLLEAMGYRARISPKGPDRGVDVFASPDGLGLEEPRIFVEVKHRPGTKISPKEIRALLGGRQAGDRCLFVSTGGYTKEARYEADRSTVPLRLLSLPDLRELLVEYYSELESGIAAMVPLERIYWPTA
jgi:restriction system protein